MNESKLTYLFQVYFNKSATTGEREELMDLLSQTENDEQLKALMSETWQQFSGNAGIFDDRQGNEMLAKIVSRSEAEPVLQPGIAVIKGFRRLRLAAAFGVLLLVTTGLYVWFHGTNQNPPLAQSAKTTISNRETILPGSNKALLTLSDGSNIVLDSAHPGILARQGNARVVNLNSATLSYKASDEATQKVVYNTLATSSGGKYQLVLSDGTKVWLNASSSIHYPTIFAGTERTVTVTGETYFEVAKNAGRPFKILVKDIEIQVLGTHFNIMAYNDETAMNTTLLEGSIKISKGAVTRMLVPGQQSSINASGNIKVIDADLEEVMAWKNGWFQFHGYDIEKIMRQISRWYNIEVAYSGKIPSGLFTGMVSRDNNIEQVLKIMQAGGVGFRIEGRRVTVYSDKSISL